MSDKMSTTLTFKEPVSGFRILKSAMVASRRDDETFVRIRCVDEGYLMSIRNKDLSYSDIHLRTVDGHAIDSGADYATCHVTSDIQAYSNASYWFVAFLNELAGELRVPQRLDYDGSFVGALSN